MKISKQKTIYVSFNSIMQNLLNIIAIINKHEKSKIFEILRSIRFTNKFYN